MHERRQLSQVGLLGTPVKLALNATRWTSGSSQVEHVKYWLACPCHAYSVHVLTLL